MSVTISIPRHGIGRGEGEEKGGGGGFKQTKKFMRGKDADSMYDFFGLFFFHCFPPFLESCLCAALFNCVSEICAGMRVRTYTRTWILIHECTRTYTLTHTYTHSLTHTHTPWQLSQMCEQ